MICSVSVPCALPSLSIAILFNSFPFFLFLFSIFPVFFSNESSLQTSLWSPLDNWTLATMVPISLITTNDQLPTTTHFKITCLHLYCHLSLGTLKWHWNDDNGTIHLRAHCLPFRGSSFRFSVLLLLLSYAVLLFVCTSAHYRHWLDTTPSHGTVFGFAIFATDLNSLAYRRNAKNANVGANKHRKSFYFFPLSLWRNVLSCKGHLISCKQKENRWNFFITHGELIKDTWRCAL